MQEHKRSVKQLGDFANPILEFITLKVNIISFFFIIKDISTCYAQKAELTMKYNERIRELREDHSYTQQNIASILNVGQRTYSDYESGKTRIPIDSILILARYYDVSVDYITGASNVKRCYPSD